MVLQSAGIGYKIVKTPDEYILIVAGERAAIELDEYARESLDGPPRGAVPIDLTLARGDDLSPLPPAQPPFDPSEPLPEPKTPLP